MEARTGWRESQERHLLQNLVVSLQHMSSELKQLQTAAARHLRGFYCNCRRSAQPCQQHRPTHPQQTHPRPSSPAYSWQRLPHQQGEQQQGEQQQGEQQQGEQQQRQDCAEPLDAISTLRCSQVPPLPIKDPLPHPRLGASRSQQQQQQQDQQQQHQEEQQQEGSWPLERSSQQARTLGFSCRNPQHASLAWLAASSATAAVVADLPANSPPPASCCCPPSPTALNRPALCNSPPPCASSGSAEPPACRRRFVHFEKEASRVLLDPSELPDVPRPHGVAVAPVAVIRPHRGLMERVKDRLRLRRHSGEAVATGVASVFWWLPSPCCREGTCYRPPPPAPLSVQQQVLQSRQERSNTRSSSSSSSSSSAFPTGLGHHHVRPRLYVPAPAPSPTYAAAARLLPNAGGVSYPQEISPANRLKRQQQQRLVIQEQRQHRTHRIGDSPAAAPTNAAPLAPTNASPLADSLQQQQQRLRQLREQLAAEASAARREQRASKHCRDALTKSSTGASSISSSSGQTRELLRGTASSSSLLGGTSSELDTNLSPFRREGAYAPQHTLSTVSTPLEAYDDE
ncbi:serine/arginine repetitive matrix protein 1-like [Cyclospora cayetanensis]|uniref:Serine/arginine repetitive matrix protein 1-like n=1 Tax=Cyclospora cayetanensis TaxID=88456 RepID=A0A6P6S433_9EIME|nr:serine/arginine repetitive matrix protein 1-like [Cyclospora cayetanensis]